MLLATPPEELAARLKALPAAGFVGANLTIPHKETGLLLCAELLESARRAGAVNTLVFKDGKTIGMNTDGAGFLANLRAHGVGPGAGPALILGAGGAARAVAAALQDEGAAVTLCNRTPERAAALAAALPPARVILWEDRTAALPDHALLVNTTSLGMQHQPALEMSLDTAGAALVVADLVYAPLETELLRAARARGLVAVDGLGMLLHQAVPGFAAWFGITPVVDDEIYRIAMS